MRNDLLRAPAKGLFVFTCWAGLRRVEQGTSVGLQDARTSLLHISLIC